jgi:hypothetical protein
VDSRREQIDRARLDDEITDWITIEPSNMSAEAVARFFALAMPG